MTSVCQLEPEFDSTRLREDLAKVLPEEWFAHYNPADHQGDWQLAALMSAGGFQENIFAASIPDICQATPLLERCAYFREVIGNIPMVKASVRLMKLEAGAQILEHSDSLGDQEARIHIPITTSPDVQFYLEGNRVEMESGSCWFLDFRRPHQVLNQGDSSRTHLVIDAIRNRWLDEQINDSTC